MKAGGCLAFEYYNCGVPCLLLLFRGVVVRSGAGVVHWLGVATALASTFVFEGTYIPTFYAANNLIKI